MLNKDKIENLCQILGGKPAPKDNSGAYSKEGIPFVRMRDLGRFHLTTNLNQTDDRLSLDYISENKIKPIPKGAILMPRSGSVALNHRAILAQDSIIVSHICALVVKDETKINNRYLYYWLTRFDMNKIAKKTTGLDAINFSDLGDIEVTYPEIETQNKIVAILDKATNILNKREDTLRKYDELLRSKFLEMFGDVAINPNNYPVSPLKEFGEVITGNTPPRSESDNYDSQFIEWIKTDNILSDSPILTKATEYLSEKGFTKARYVDENALLVACIAGSLSSIGRAAISDRRVAFNQQINAIVPSSDVSVHFLYWLFKVSAEYIQSFATSGMKKLLTKGEFEKIPLIKPDYQEQLKFENIALFYSQLCAKLKKHHFLAEQLLKSLSQQVFNEKISIDVDTELESLVNSIDLEKKDDDNSIYTLLNDVTFLQRLIDRLQAQEFTDDTQYEKAKYILFRIIKEEPNLVKQEYDSETKKIILSI